LERLIFSSLFSQIIHQHFDEINQQIDFFPFVDGFMIKKEFNQQKEKKPFVDGILNEPIANYKS